MKKSVIFALSSLACLTVGALTGCSSSSGTSNHYFNVRIWNNEFQNRFRAYSTLYKETLSDGNDLLKDGTILRWNLVENKNNKYQNALDDAIAAQDSADQEDKIDMFLVEADYAMKYSAQDIALDVKGDIGLTDTDLAQQYDYTKKILTYDGKLKGVSWQATPGLYAYRTDIADDVLGTHDSDEVQAKISDWTKFNDVAAQMKKKGYCMLAGKDDSYRTYSNNVTSKWVTEDAKGVPTCHLDDNIKNWVRDTKSYADNGYLAGSGDSYALWGSDWGKQMSKAGKTFGFFWST
jgi:ABC-type glycerol-3-phosphate transport system substrate-binding protein